jgi:hypothetical protein
MMKRGDSLQPPPNQKARVVAGVIVLVVVLVFGSIAGVTYISIQNANQTADIDGAPTATPTPGLPALFEDPFNNNSNGWNVEGDPKQYTVAFDQGGLLLENKQNKLLWEMLPGNRTFGDFKLNVEANLIKGDQINGYGVYIRGKSNQASDLATYYRFALFGDGGYAVFKGILGPNGETRDSKLVDYTPSQVIVKAGAKAKLNEISIIAKGSSMSFMVNGRTLTRITDSSYTSGTIALYVSNLKNARPGAQAKFSNLSIYPPNA